MTSNKQSLPKLKKSQILLSAIEEISKEEMNLIPRSKYIQKNSPISSRKLSLPLIDSITIKDPRIEMVECLTISSNKDIGVSSLYKLRHKKEEIDLNEEIAYKRLHCNIKYEKETRRENLEKLELKEREIREGNELRKKEDTYNNNKSKYEDNVNQINYLYNQINDAKISLKLLSDSRMFQMIENRLSRINDNITDDHKKKNKKYLFGHMTRQAIENEEIQRKKEMFKNNIKEYQNQIIQLKAMQPNLLEAVNKSKLLFYNTRKELSEYYHLLLYEGLDFRNEGLITIIKNIWDLGLNVDITFMPSYLDCQSIDYIFTRARQTIQINKIKKILEETKQIIANDYKDEIINKNITDNVGFNHKSNILTKNKNNFFRTNLKIIEEENDNNINKQNSITEKFMNNYKRKNEITEELTLKSIKEKLKKNKSINDEIINKFNDLKGIENFVKKLEERLHVMKKNEMLRIAKEFLNNNYQERYKVCIETVFSALCGEEGKNAQMIFFSNYSKNYNKTKQQAKFYSTYLNEKIVANKSSFKEVNKE